MMQLSKLNPSGHDLLIKQDREIVHNNLEIYNLEHFLREKLNIEPED